MEHNFVRAEHLSLLSLEFLALIFALYFSIFYFRLNLIKLYLIFIPFTDKVYRVFDLQPADIIAILILLFYWKFVKIRNLYFYLFCLTLAAGSAVGFIFFSDVFSIMYSFRIIITCLCSLTIFELLKNNVYSFAEIRKIYRSTIIFSCFFCFLQALLWTIGLPIDGVFYVDYIRVKGLAHEPSTFGLWIALSLPLIFKEKLNYSNQSTTEIDKPLVFWMSVATVLTSSASAIMTMIFMLFLMGISSQHIRSSKKVSYLIYGIFFISMLTILFPSAMYNNVFSKAITYITELSDPSIEDTSGRGGDRFLFLFFAESPWTGLGVFRSSRLNDLLEGLGVDGFIPASNFYITTFVEYGLILGPLVLLMIFIWFYWVIKKSIKINSNWGFATCAWFFSMAAMRVFGFHQPWLNYSFFLYDKYKNENSLR